MSRICFKITQLGEMGGITEETKFTFETGETGQWIFSFYYVSFYVGNPSH